MREEVLLAWATTEPSARSPIVQPAWCRLHGAPASAAPTRGDGSIEIGTAEDDDEAGEGVPADDVHVAVLDVDHDGQGCA